MSFEASRDTGSSPDVKAVFESCVVSLLDIDSAIQVDQYAELFMKNKSVFQPMEFTGRQSALAQLRRRFAEMDRLGKVAACLAYFVFEKYTRIRHTFLCDAAYRPNLQTEGYLLAEIYREQNTRDQLIYALLNACAFLCPLNLYCLLLGSKTAMGLLPEMSTCSYYPHIYHKTTIPQNPNDAHLSITVSPMPVCHMFQTIHLLPERYPSRFDNHWVCTYPYFAVIARYCGLVIHDAVPTADLCVRAFPAVKSLAEAASVEQDVLFSAVCPLWAKFHIHGVFFAMTDTDLESWKFFAPPAYRVLSKYYSPALHPLFVARMYAGMFMLADNVSIYDQARKRVIVASALGETPDQYYPYTAPHELEMSLFATAPKWVCSQYLSSIFVLMQHAETKLLFMGTPDLQPDASDAATCLDPRGIYKGRFYPEMKLQYMSAVAKMLHLCNKISTHGGSRGVFVTERTAKTEPVASLLCGDYARILSFLVCASDSDSRTAKHDYFRGHRLPLKACNHLAGLVPRKRTMRFNSALEQVERRDNQENISAYIPLAVKALCDYGMHLLARVPDQDYANIDRIYDSVESFFVKWRLSF